MIFLLTNIMLCVSKINREINFTINIFTMIRKIPYKNGNIWFRDEGRGEVIVLLHGFLESLTVWDEFEDELKDRFRLIMIDLPGHGESNVIAEVHSMELLAESVNVVLENLDIDKCTLIGHSMGGYVALAFLELFPEKTTGLCLFHSSPFADPDDKKTNRDRQINLIKEGKKGQICSAHFPKTFADENVEKFKTEINFAVNMAKNTSDDGIIALLKGMKNRRDKSELLKNAKIPFLYILGMKDNFIPSSILNKMEMPENTTVLKLENSGHMGLFEEKDKCIQAITEFVEKK